MILFLCVFFASFTFAAAEEHLTLDIVSYELLMKDDPKTVQMAIEALNAKGIVGVKGVPNFIDIVQQFIEASRSFCSLPENTKEKYAPNREQGDLFLGYEKGKEKFKTSDGTWVIDDLKISYYAFVPDQPSNKWPQEVMLKDSYENLGSILATIGEKLMNKIELIGPSTGIFVKDVPKVGRLLYYQKNSESYTNNSLWCGAHFDHGLFTALIPATYFLEGKQIEEPEEAGLFVNVEGQFKKIKADSDVMLFQVGEFGQLASNDRIKATQHYVHKAKCDNIERFTMALFFEAPIGTVIHSHSELTQDSRYGGKPGDPCTYQHWSEESFKRYIVD